MNRSSAAAVPNFSRRDFIRGAGTVAVLGALDPLSAHASEASPATCVHVFARPLERLSYADTASLVAEGGYGGIDFTVRPKGGHIQPEKVEDDLPRAVEAAQKAGLKVEMIATGIVDARPADTERILRTASRLGVKYYRLGVFDHDPKLGVWNSLQKLRPVFKDLADISQAHGMHGAVQNHPGVRIGAPVWDLFELFRDLDPRWIGCQYDIRHATVEGFSSWPLGLKLLAPWIRCTDIKDFRWERSARGHIAKNVPLGEGLVKFDEYFRLARELNISGPISVHFEYGPFERADTPLNDPSRRPAVVAALRHDRKKLQDWMTRHRIA
ncbi:MAG: sugar phosphate isomerase/epimerase [Opitutus sp.]|nr:sugar phosphate isomerase/epimerase [Opitutus sp.]